MTIELTVENFSALADLQTKGVLGKLLEHQLATKFTIENDYRATFANFSLGSFAKQGRARWNVSKVRSMVGLLENDHSADRI